MRVALLLALVTGCTPDPCQDAIQSLASGSDIVSEDLATEAIDACELPLENATPAAYHNTALLHHQRGETAAALAYWRTAHEFAPRNPRYTDALARTRGSLITAPEPVPSMYRWMDIASPLEVSWLALLCWLLFSTLTFRSRRDTPQLLRQLPLGALALALSVAGWQGRQAQLHSPAAVVKAETSAFDSPSLQGSAQFDLRAFTEVRIVRRAGAFLLVTDAKNRTGWIHQSQLVSPAFNK